MRIKNLFFYLLILPARSIIIRKPLKAYYHTGIDIGITTLSAGILMDNTVSKNSLNKLKNETQELYNEGISKSVTNLLFVGPSYHFILENFIISDHLSKPIFFETFSIVLIHSLGYYFFHRLMHRNDLFRKHHNFHHRFNETLIPSIANSVSLPEFTFSYMVPFICGQFLINPNINSFNLAIIIVSFMNLIIHTQELANIEYSPFLVSPENHVNHHRGKNKGSLYSAPTFNLEYIYSLLKKKYD